MIMSDQEKPIETLLEQTIEHAEKSIKLVKLKTLDKTSEVVSSFIPHSIVLVLIIGLFLFLSLGIAIWLGELMGSNSFGFFVVAAFYGILGLIVHFFMHNMLKKKICDYIIKQVLK